MGLFFIPKLTKKHLLFLGFSISAFLRDWIPLLIVNTKDSQDKGDKEKKCIQKRYFDIITNIISDLLQGIFVAFNKMKFRKESRKLTNERFNSQIENNKDKDKDKDNNINFKSFIKIMIKICIVDYVCQFLFLLFSLIFRDDDIIQRKNNNYLLIIDILSRFIFCRLILDTYFYKHHIVSMIVNIIIFIIVGIFDFHFIFKDQTELEKTIIYFCFLIFQSIAYSLEDVLNKIALSKELLTPYSLLFCKGLLEIPLLIITTIIIYFIEDPFSYFSSLDSKEKKYDLIRRGIFIILNIFRSIFLVQVIDKFSSPFLSILKVLESLFMFLYFLIVDKYNEDKINDVSIYIYIIPVSFIIIVFTSLVYNEVIVINCCGLEDFTQYGLDVQAEKDLRDAISEMSDDVSQTCDSRTDSIVEQNETINDE